MSAPATSLDGRNLELVPPIDRYFPECWCACVEAVSKYQFGVADFGKIYGRHGFAYRRPAGPFRLRPDGVQLDVELHRAPLPDGELESLIGAVYGIRVQSASFTSFDAYWEYCRESLGHGAPVIIDFDLGFIRARREYGKVFGPHAVVLCGYDPRAGMVMTREQMLGSQTIGMDDFERCLARKLGAAGEARLWRVTRGGHSERQLARDEVVDRARANLENLSSPDPAEGLAGLARFSEDLQQYLGSPAFEDQPFSIPGMWVFSHERHIERKWLSSVRQLCPARDQPSLAEFDLVLERLFKLWLSTDYLLEKCLAAESGKTLRSLPKYFAALLAEERLALNGWMRLHESLSAAT